MNYIHQMSIGLSVVVETPDKALFCSEISVRNEFIEMVEK